MAEKFLLPCGVGVAEREALRGVRCRLLVAVSSVSSSSRGVYLREGASGTRAGDGADLVSRPYQQRLRAADTLVEERIVLAAA